MKIVYEGMEFKVPKGTRYVAADDSGDVYAYRGREELSYDSGKYRGTDLKYVGDLPDTESRKRPAVKVERIIMVTPITDI